MRAFELLTESDYSERLLADLDNIIITAKGSGNSEIQTPELVAMLNTMGYQVTPGALLSLLSNVPTVAGVSQDVITFADTSPTLDNGGESSEDVVSDLAANANKLG